MSWRATTRRNRTYHVTTLSVREDSAPSPRRTDRSSKPAETSKACCPCHQVPRVKATDRAEAADVLFQRRVSLARSVPDHPCIRKERPERVLTHPIVVSERLPPTHKQQHPPSYSTLQASLRCSIINVLTARGITPRATPSQWPRIRPQDMLPPRRQAFVPRESLQNLLRIG